MSTADLSGVSCVCGFISANVQALAAILSEELDALRALQKRAAKELLR